MAKFIWEIDEVSIETASGGEAEVIDLDGVKTVAVKDWKIQESDKTVVILPVQGGTVGQIGDEGKAAGVAAEGEQKPNSSDGEAELYKIIMLITVFLGIGFLIVLVNAVIQQKLDFETYIGFLGWFLAVLFGRQVGKKLLKSN